MESNTVATADEKKLKYHVIVTFEHGHPTRLVNQRRLAEKVLAYGSPDFINGHDVAWCNGVRARVPRIDWGACGVEKRRIMLLEVE